jgi:hypothetical protein
MNIIGQVWLKQIATHPPDTFLQLRTASFCPLQLVQQELYPDYRIAKVLTNKH